eukprot:TRINITY_DN3717_c0_g2_i1.p1 TRINITY_DN3717_c0_g2~~TRINITY_DN3717_c0_g2_i1.p1  ORF type:complete len:768 (+),score=147.30 TRINITY_DN3717_c0_g2_i1:107-2410(+)
MAATVQRSQSEDGETTFEELAQQGPQHRFQRLMAKDSRRYELLVFAVEACYLLIYLGYFLIELQSQTSLDGSDVGSDRSPKPFPLQKNGKGPKIPNLNKNTKEPSGNDKFYSSCVDDLWAKNQARMSSIEAEIHFKDSLGMAVQVANWCRSELLGDDVIGEFLSAVKINNFIPVVFVILRAYRLFGCHERFCARCKIKSAWLSWALDTLFHTLVLSWYGTMAGLFSVMNINGGQRGHKFVESLYIGPSVYVFILTVSCLTVLDVRQTVIASTISYSCFAIPSLTSLFNLMGKINLGDQKLLVLDQVMLFFAIVAVCYARYSSWRDRAGDFKRADKLMAGIINEKVKRCAAEFNAERLQASLKSGPSDGQDTDYLSMPMQHAEADPFATSPAAMWPSPPSCLSAPADMDRLTFLEKGGEPRCDCLPLSAKVYLNGAAGSTAASELLEGDQVLCYDHLAGSIRFVEVEDVGTVSGECQWSHMVMADGTRVSVTADHPVRVVGQTPELPDSEMRGAWGLGGGRVSRAGNLRPGKDMLKLLRLGAVPLAEMHTEIDTAPRIRVNLKQSWRYSLFCSQSAGLEMTAVAVESSNALEGRARDDVQVKNGFLHSAEERGMCNPPAKPKSAPGRLITVDVLEFGKSDGGMTKETMTTEEIARDRGSSTDATWAGGSSDEKEALADMTDSSQEAQDELHATGKCHPCLFEYRHQTEPDKYPRCMKADCHQRCCHQIHSDDFVQQYKAAKRKYEKKNRLAFRKENGQGQVTPIKVAV